MKTIVATLVIVMVLCAQNSSAQSGTAQANRNIKRNIATVLFASIGGGILGLSTLSFYDKPEDHTNNITMGALLGFVAGTGYVVMNNTSSAPQRAEGWSQAFPLEKKEPRMKPVAQIAFDF